MSNILILMTIGAPIIVMMFYVILGINRDNRAKNVSEYLIYDKKIPSHLYTTGMVAYALQLAVTVYFIYWGFRFGIGTLWYLAFWWLGLYLFERSAPKLLEFARGNRTLHGHLETEYGKKWKLRQLAALCTILGMLGALIVELNFATDLFTSFISTATNKTTPSYLWITVFSVLCLFALWYVTIGGYKAAIITDDLQLPIAIIGSFIVISYVGILGSLNGYKCESIYLFALTLLYLAGIFYFRKRNHREVYEIEHNAKISVEGTKVTSDYVIPALFISAIIIISSIIYSILNSSNIKIT